jgi:ATP phosphoribosyltransferase
MLQIALPNKGALSEEAVQLVRDAGYSCRRYGRELILCDRENDVEFVFLRPRDIAVYVSNGVLDLGITGRDLAADSESEVEELLSLGFGRSDFYYAVPKESTLTPEAFSHVRIATSYPNLVLRDLARRNIESEVIRLDGAVEISIRLGVADVIADVVQTGKTLEQAGLKTVGGSLLKSEAVLIARSPHITGNNGAKLFLERLRGIVVAREYVIVEYDVLEKSLEDACQITPGIESPTISPLSKKGWVAVKAMGKKRDINRIMDELTRIDAKGIIVTDIRTCRI